MNSRIEPGKIARLVFSIVCILFLLIASFRFYARDLEQRVVGINGAIDGLNSQELSLKQELSALMSPNRIFNYCRDNLGMRRTTDFVTINGAKQ